MNSRANFHQYWDWEINAKKSSWNWDVKNILSYRHLLFRMVRKEFLVNYQQTVLGPIWIFIQPLLVLLTYVLVFGKLIRVPTAPGSPQVLFYLCGIILWNFFNEGFLLISRTFREHIHIFSKVYFPRIIIPLSVLVTQFLRFCIQMMLLFLLILYYIFFEDYHPIFSYRLWLLPFSIIICGMLSLGTGLIFSVFTGKYRDVINIVEVGVRLLFFVTPVVYSSSIIPFDLHWVMSLNPLTSVFESFRLAILGSGQVTSNGMAYSFLLSCSILILSIFIFNREGTRLIDII